MPGVQSSFCFGEALCRDCQKKPPVIHFAVQQTYKSDRLWTLCRGVVRQDVSTRREEVTCKNCLRKMGVKIHRANVYGVPICGTLSAAALSIEPDEVTCRRCRIVQESAEDDRKLEERFRELEKELNL